MEQRIKRPPVWQYLTELPRAIFEYIKSRSFIKRHQFSRNGNGQVVLVVPGFMADGTSTRPMVQLLKRNGYQAYNWGFGRNLGRLKDVEKLLEKAEFLSKKHQQKIILIGWSLGGVYSRIMAQEKPYLFRQVITMGSPFADINAPNYATWLFRLLNGQRNKDLEEKWIPSLPKALSIPTVAIYSKQDGIVPWKACMEVNPDAEHKNIEVRGSHLGLGLNKNILSVLGEVLISA